MRATLFEVLGQEMGESMYSLEWLKDRATSHVDGRRPGAIFITYSQRVVGMVWRGDSLMPHTFGSIPEIYIGRPTITSETSFPLIELFNSRGYEIVFHSEEKKTVA